MSKVGVGVPSRWGKKTCFKKVYESPFFAQNDNKLNLNWVEFVTNTKKMTLIFRLNVCSHKHKTGEILI